MTRLVARLGPSGPTVTAEGGERVHLDDRRLLGLITGASPAPDGTVHLDGRDVTRLRPAARVRAGIVAVVDAPVADEVSVRDHLAARAPVAEADRVVAACPLLSGRAGDPAGVLSGGERRALAWLRAVIAAPRVVVLQDATVGLDAATRTWTDELVAGWLAAGAVVLEG